MAFQIDFLSGKPFQLAPLSSLPLKKIFFEVTTAMKQKFMDPCHWYEMEQLSQNPCISRLKKILCRSNKCMVHTWFHVFAYLGYGGTSIASNGHHNLIRFYI
jgi:hypothetical protein